MSRIFRPHDACGTLASFYFECEPRPHQPWGRTVDAGDGRKVRSHPEAQIVRVLRELGVTWVYEATLHHANAPSKRPVLSPDFLVIDPTGYAWVWEHVGMLSDPTYLARHTAKSKIYEALGIIDVQHGGGEFATLLTTYTHGNQLLADSKMATALEYVETARAA